MKGVKRILVVGILFSAVFMLSVSAWSGTINLPKTGQTTCYDSSGNVIACTGTRQDGAIQAGVAWPSPRFTDNGDQTQTDNLTSLIWPKNGGTPTVGSCTGGTMNSWQAALDYVACLNNNNYLGHNDWRVPNVNELESIVNGGQSNMAIWLNDQGFTNVQSDYYWSSTSYAYNPSGAWHVLTDAGSVYAGTGNAGGVFAYLKTTSNNYVWPVRGGQDTSVIWRTGQTTCYDTNGNIITCTGAGQDGELQKGVSWPSPRFTDNGDQSVTDNLTKLMWTKSANAPGPLSCNPGTAMTWQGALNYVSCLNTNNYLGHNDWRLPNRKELYSLTDFSQYNPSIPAGNPFTGVQLNNYWSSTSYAYSPSYAWLVNMSGGGVRGGDKTNSFYVWAVRGGQPGSFGYLISGTITYNGSRLSGATVTLSGAGSGATTTDGNGNYSFTGLSNGSYTITPSKSGYTFTARNVIINGANLTGVNFTASISGGGPTLVGYNWQWLIITILSLTVVGVYLLRRERT